MSKVPLSLLLNDVLGRFVESDDHGMIHMLSLLDQKKVGKTEVEISSAYLHDAEMIIYRAMVRDVGLDIGRVLSVVDPAIHFVVQRLLQLGAVTFSCCSGHVAPQIFGSDIKERNPYLYLTFKDIGMGQEFHRRMLEAFSSDSLYPVQVRGHVVRMYDMAIVELSVVESQSRFLPVQYRWEKQGEISSLQELWQQVMFIISTFDGVDPQPISPGAFHVAGEPLGDVMEMLQVFVEAHMHLVSCDDCPLSELCPKSSCVPSPS